MPKPWGQEIALVVLRCLGGPFIKNLLTLILDTSLASLVAQRVKHLPAMQEDPLEKEMATQLQYSCLENPMAGEAW